MNLKSMIHSHQTYSGKCHVLPSSLTADRPVAEREGRAGARKSINPNYTRYCPLQMAVFFKATDFFLVFFFTCELQNVLNPIGETGQ